MSFRFKLLFAFGATTVVAVAVVAVVATRLVRNSYIASDQQRINRVLAQARSAIERRGEEAARRVGGVAESEAVTRIAIGLNQPEGGAAPGMFVREAAALARAYDLQLLEIVADDGTVLSSAQLEARAGYREAGLALLEGRTRPFVSLEEVPGGAVLAISALREVTVGPRKLYVLGGYRLEDSLLAELKQPGIDYIALFQLARGRLERVAAFPDFDSEGVAELRRVAERAALGGAEYRVDLPGGGRTQPTSLRWPSTAAGMPIQDAWSNSVGAFVVIVSGAERARVIRSLYGAAAIAGGMGLVVALLLSVVLAGHITAPVKAMTRASQELAAGNLDYRIATGGSAAGARRSRDEMARLAEAFNQMAASLKEHRERLVQAERVAAWRELARRLAHELKNPLFPLQLSVENLRRVRQVDPAQFDEAFEEATATLLQELEELKRIVGRFSDFARMPQPQVEPTDVRELLEKTAKVYEGRMRQQNIELDFRAPERVTAQADPHLLGNALGNLVLNALDAMPKGGRLALAAFRQNGRVVVEVADTGAGLTPEEQQRLFTPYYTTKQHGTGLGLAIVQSVVADHGGRVSVESEPEKGTKFRIELPAG